MSNSRWPVVVSADSGRALRSIQVRTGGKQGDLWRFMHVRCGPACLHCLTRMTETQILSSRPIAVPAPQYRMVPEAEVRDGPVGRTADAGGQLSVNPRKLNGNNI
jgi:hypothetical protein